MTIEFEGHLTTLTRVRSGKSSVYLHSCGNTYELIFGGPGLREPALAPFLRDCGPGREIRIRGDFERDPEGLKLRVTAIEHAGQRKGTK